ncbi:hypothetical protein J1N35_020684 [Gossypium stocksii]|uniref:Uncharacterized protein n=1 Tax=Gossypium stocksii TaxID=47602 RepID=A0A9D3VD36_9ROSI|nr:hypothetical protein J1N35_020684 [Gossypium stocksii]
MGWAMVLRNDMGGFVHCGTSFVRGNLDLSMVEVLTTRDALFKLKLLQVDDIVLEIDCQWLWYAFSNNSLDMLDLGIRRSTNRAAHTLVRVTLYYTNY